VQSDLIDIPTSVTVCPTTADGTGAGLLRPRIMPSAGNGLREPSWIMVDKITTIPRTKVGRRVGRLEDEVLHAVDTALMIHLGLAGNGSLAA
jgi:mRNA interferase MazF